MVAVAFATIALLLTARTVDSLSNPAEATSSWRAGDTAALVGGAKAAVSCLKDGTWHGCGALPAGMVLPDYPDVEGSRVERFPPLLYVPAILVQAAGGGQELSLRLIGVISLLSFGGLLALPWIVGPRAGGLHRHRHLWALLILASPLLPYAGSTWSEVPAALLLAATVVLVAADIPPVWIALVALGAGLSKDTAPPLVIALAFAVARHQRPNGRWLTNPPSLFGAVAGSLGALAVTAAFNVFRFDSVTNVTYLAPTFQVRRPTAVAGHGLALLFSPNGGLLAFWPMTVVLFVMAAISWRRGAAIRLRLALLAVTGGGFLLSLALWWSPFGWHSWSPRLSLPLVPALGAAVLLLAPADLGPRRALLLAAAAATVLALPQAGITGNSVAIGRFMAAPRPACTVGAQAEREFVRCNLDRAWRQQPGLLLEGLRGFAHPVAGPLAAATTAGGLGLIVLWADEARPRRREKHPLEASPSPERSSA